MRCVFWIHLFLILVLNTSSAELTISRSCQSHCGKISIPYPFGIGNGCYLNEWYEVQCNHSTSRKFVPLLPMINKEVVQIDLPRDDSNLYGSLRIKTNITSMVCSVGDGQNLEELLNFTGTPFTIGDNNSLMAFGCNNKATLTNIDPILVGCISTCSQIQHNSDSGCYGYKCCHASTPIEVGSVIGVKIESSDSNKTREECNVAFITDEYNEPSLWHNRTDPKRLHAMKYATIQLNWEVLTKNLSFKESLECGEYLDEFSSYPCHCLWDIEIAGGCACISGYEGNPYILKGCKGVSIGLSVLMVGVGIYMAIHIY